MPRRDTFRLDTWHSCAVPEKDHKTPPAAPAGRRRPQPRSRSGERATPVYSIRVGDGEELRCASCGRRASGAGPVGYRDEETVCDLCLFEGNATLGMVLALISVIRAYAALSSRAPRDLLDALGEVDTFARIYECFAAKTSPLRVFRLPGFTEKD